MELTFAVVAVKIGGIFVGVVVEVGLRVGGVDAVSGLAGEVVVGFWSVPEHPFIKMKTGTKSQKSFFVRAEFILSSLVALK
jgi:hypothetical protein